jgi:mono/diheme cytochrome c family protein
MEHRERTSETAMRSFALCFATAAVAMIVAACSADEAMRADPSNARQVASGKAVYDRNCAACHGGNLEGQPEWRSRLPNGRLPAPPHDDAGHTWHHGDDLLFGLTKFGLTPPYGPPAYQSDMPAFGKTLSDQQIWDALAYIKSRWSARSREVQMRMQTKGGG